MAKKPPKKPTLQVIPGGAPKKPRRKAVPAVPDMEGPHKRDGAQAQAEWAAQAQRAGMSGETLKDVMPGTVNPEHHPIPPMPKGVLGMNRQRLPAGAKGRGPGQPGMWEADPQAWTRLIVALRYGNTVSAACAWAGVSRESFYEGLKKGKKATQPDDPYRQFYLAVHQAYREAEVALVTHVHVAGQKGQWKAAAYLLGVRNPQRYIPPQKVQHSGDKDQPVVFQMNVPKPPHLQGKEGAE